MADGTAAGAGTRTIGRSMMIETKRAMGMAIDQIRRLRQHNEVLQAKVDTMELLAGFLHAQVPSLRGGMEEDAAWLLQRELEKIEKAESSLSPPHAEGRSE